MEIDWRALLNELRIPWKDRGANTSRNNVNVCCPFCGNDPSYHLGIAETKEAYYCFREPNRHSGKNFLRLLQAFEVDYASAQQLLRRYQRAGHKTPEPAAKISGSQAARAWERFASATDSGECLAYLARRGFPDPKDAASVYDLRHARVGDWARRLLLPFPAINGKTEIAGWTGRALDPARTPKYLTLGAEHATLPYAPRPGFQRQILVLVEGPLDALKLDDACRRSAAGGIFAIAALQGKQINARKLLALREMARGCRQIILAMDADVKATASYAIIAELASAIKIGHISRAKLPAGIKDPAELQSGEIVAWLQQTSKLDQSL